MPLKEIRGLSTYTKTFFIISSIVFALIFFAAGVSVGYNKAAFNQNWNTGYYQNMSRVQSFFAPVFHRGDNLNSHGAIGDITSINLPTFVVRGPNQAEQIVNISSSTVIRYLRLPAHAQDLSLGSQVLVVGYPNESGRIEATFIRIVGNASSTNTNTRQ